MHLLLDSNRSTHWSRSRAYSSANFFGSLLISFLFAIVSNFRFFLSFLTVLAIFVVLLVLRFSDILVLFAISVLFAIFVLFCNFLIFGNFCDFRNFLVFGKICRKSWSKFVAKQYYRSHFNITIFPLFFFFFFFVIEIQNSNFSQI